ncbi:unnamed protein product [Durusdinium trenchii]|uniref:Uncharacterized protein n=1 Tax=Durusdinium trenchii TaxID=1381693 RepID=A0ABP0R706_9DINO
MGSDKCDWRKFEEATGKLLEMIYGKGNVTKPAFRATERKDNDFCQEGHAHQPPGSQKSKTSNPDFIVSLPDGRKGVVDAKYYTSSLLTVESIDKLLSDKKSHEADFCILVVYKKEGFNPIPESIARTIKEHGIQRWFFDGNPALWNTMQKESVLNTRQKESVKKALSLLDAGDTSGSLRLINSVMRQVPTAEMPVLDGSTALGILRAQHLWDVLGLGRSKTLMGLATGKLRGIGTSGLAATSKASASGIAATSKASASAFAGLGAPIVALSFLSCALAAGAIGLAIHQVKAAEERLNYAKSVMEFLKESSRHVDHFKDEIKRLEEDRDNCAKLLADVKQMEEDNEEAQLNAHLWLMLLLHEKIPSLLGKVKDLSAQMLEKANHLQHQKDASTSREESAQTSERENGVACGLSAGGAALGLVATGLSAIPPFTPLLAVTIPATAGLAITAGLTGHASAQAGDTKVWENRNGGEIQSQINELERIQVKCQELLQDGQNLSDQVAELMGQMKERQSKLHPGSQRPVHPGSQRPVHPGSQRPFLKWLIWFCSVKPLEKQWLFGKGY